MKKIILVCAVFLMISGCGMHEAVVQKAEKSFVKFTGNLSGISVQIDTLDPFDVGSFDDNKLYQIAPGKHTIKIYRDGKLIVNRLLFVDSQAIAEVMVP